MKTGEKDSNNKPTLRISISYTSAHQKLIHGTFHKIPDQYSPKLLRSSKTRKSDDLSQPRGTIGNMTK